jgi:hypothetical protein
MPLQNTAIFPFIQGFVQDFTTVVRVTLREVAPACGVRLVVPIWQRRRRSVQITKKTEGRVQNRMAGEASAAGDHFSSQTAALPW